MVVSKSVISRLKKAAEGGKTLRKHAEGRGRNIIPLEDRYVAPVVKKNRNFTPVQIAETSQPLPSPDLNPIQNAWDALGRRVAQRTVPFRTVQELKIALTEE
ncbi:hypothetical protein TNCV_2102431 [Trichonephila clavipes]|nr:hypothetical protein TNCV_2102431 [Trichonephila clavipes]